MSPTQICNLSIAWLSGNVLTNLDTDSSNEAILCRATYDPARLFVLEQTDWSFARQLHALLPVTPTPDFGYANRFLIPTGVLVVRQVANNPQDLSPQSYWNARDTDFQYSIRGNHIECSADKLYIAATMDIEDSGAYSGTFVQALAAKIGIDIAVPLTQSGSSEERMIAKYSNYLRDAMAIDGIQSKARRITSDSLIRVRQS